MAGAAHGLVLQSIELATLMGANRGKGMELAFHRLAHHDRETTGSSFHHAPDGHISRRHHVSGLGGASVLSREALRLARGRTPAGRQEGSACPQGSRPRNQVTAGHPTDDLVHRLRLLILTTT